MKYNFEENVSTMKQIDILKIRENASRYGGTFENYLSMVYIRSNRYDRYKIEKAFPEFINKFLNL